MEAEVVLAVIPMVSAALVIVLAMAAIAVVKDIRRETVSFQASHPATP